MRRASDSTYPKTMVVIRDCYWSHNRYYNIENRIVERFFTNMVRLMGWQFILRKPKPTFAK